ncbi:tetratricopeptide repeat protein [Bacteriovoracaceae bacterium]|nr:tetratricopeptide repeat protein [Bacteriovoracaceae bacterium]
MNKILIMGLALLAPFFYSCDFTPRIHKEVLKAQNLIAKQEYQKAIDNYEKILVKNPPNELKTKILYQIGDLYSLYLSKNKKSLKYYQEIKEITDSPLWLVKTEERLGDINFLYLQDYEKSLTSYKLLSEFRPKLQKQDFYRFRYGLSLLNLDNLYEAANIFKEISEEKNSDYNIQSIYQLGLIQFQIKNWKGAVKYLNDYIKLESRRDNIVQAKFLMANAYETMEELKIAYNIYYSILGEYPNTEVVNQRLESIYKRRIARKR